MNFKAMAAVVSLGFGGTVLALAATRDTPGDAPVVAENPAPKPAEPVAEQVAQIEPIKHAPIMIAQQDTKPAVVEVAAKAPPPAVEKTPPKPTATQQQLDALLAPVALYPDQLLSQILMASTYPLDVVEAARWRTLPENQSLTGEPLTAALEDKDWDPSVKALVPFPEILKMMDSDLDWMAAVGDAFADQQTDVMDSVQRLRREARAADRLASDNRRQVIVEDDQILIEPASPDVVYVPFYNPADAYGVWPYPDYPPAYIPPPVGYTYAPYVVYNFVSVNPFWTWSRWDWRHRHIRIIDPPRWKHYHHGHDHVWRHDPNRGGRGRGGDRWRGHRPQPGVTPHPQPPQQPIVVRDGRRNIDAPPAQPIRPRHREFQRQPGTLPDLPPLPATGHLPAVAPPITNPNIGVQAPEREQVDTMRARRPRDHHRRDHQRQPPQQQWQQQQQEQERNDALRRRQFQNNTSIDAPVLSNVPPTQQQGWRFNNIGGAPVPSTQTMPAPMPNSSVQMNQAQINAMRARQEQAQQWQQRQQGRQQPGLQMPAPAVPAIAPAPPAIAPIAPQVSAPAPIAPQPTQPRVGRGSGGPPVGAPSRHY
jgi:hypothetical protein